MPPDPTHPFVWRLITLAVALAPATAVAGNGTHPRTPVLWPQAPCRTIVDRSIEPILGMEYTIPYEDVDATPDEVVAGHSAAPGRQRLPRRYARRSRSAGVTRPGESVKTR